MIADRSLRGDLLHDPPPVPKSLPPWPHRRSLLAVFAPGRDGIVLADEGMWVFNNLPLEHLKEKYGFEPPPGWVEHLRSSAVRFNSGGSGSFVSADGLVMTNHHVGADMLQKISTAEKDYYKDGFLREDARRGGQGPRPRAERAGRRSRT